MNNDKQKQGFIYSITNVRQILFIVNESLISKPTEVVISSLNAKTGFNVEAKLLNLTLRAWYHYKDENTELAVTEVENVFHIENIEKYINDGNELIFPSQLWVNIVGISISHTRALFTRSLSGTAFQNVILSIMDPYIAAKHFFPQSFPKEENTVKLKTKEDKPKTAKKKQ